MAASLRSPDMALHVSAAAAKPTTLSAPQIERGRSRPKHRPKGGKGHSCKPATLRPPGRTKVHYYPLVPNYKSF